MLAPRHFDLLSGKRRARRSSPQSRLLIAAVAATIGAGLSAQHQFAETARLPSGNQGTTDVALGDVDGDGDVDLVVAYNAHYGRPSGGIQLQINDGRGGFEDRTFTNLPNRGTTGVTHAIALGDVDGDGDLDLIVADINPISGAGQRLWLNDSSGIFTVASAPFPRGQGVDIAVGDIDGDGDLDIVWAAYYGNRAYVNNGAGTFRVAPASQLPLGNSMALSAALGDVDNDGDLDLVFGNDGQNTLYLNDGSGTFTDATASRMPVDGVGTSALVLGDVDGDGDLDMLLGNGGYYTYTTEQNTLYLNQGGTFVDATVGNLPVSIDGTEAVVLVDLDGDGDLDAMLGGWAQVSRFYLNDGRGSFADVSLSRLPAVAFGGTSGIAFGDLDGDHDMDTVFASGTAVVYTNLLRQLDAPAAPTIGQSYQLDVYARYGEPRLFDVALPYVSFAPASILLPSVGTIAIDPAQAFALPPLLIPQPAGIASTTLAIPNNPAFVGLNFYAQALHVPYPLSPRLTNATLGVVQ